MSDNQSNNKRIVKTLDSILKPNFKRCRDFAQYIKYLCKFHASHIRILREIKKNDHARVAFIVSSLSMWKSQTIVEKMLKDPRFDVKIILSPFTSYTMEEQQDDITKLRTFFSKKDIPFEDYTFDNSPYDIRGRFNPHILFYMQSYSSVICSAHSRKNYRDRLQAYIPYSFWPGNESFGFDLPFHREAWRIYYANNILIKVAKSFSLINARNSRVTGYPSSDLFTSKLHEDVWKIKDRKYKRIIWAPHFSIDPKRCLVNHSSFFTLCDFMVDYAKKHTDSIQIVFKPHPRLKSELIRIWGEKRTNSYYSLWSSMPNTQVETGSYIDLFMTSDALIHECGSFMVEYLYSKKPCIYVIDEFEKFYNDMNELGQKALDLHYKGTTASDVEEFISNVVVNGNDTLKSEREEFYNTQLLPPNGRTTAENIYNDLVSSLFN